MKQHVLNKCYPVTGSLEAEYTNSASSDHAQNLLNKVPLDITICESYYDTKMYTTVLLIALCIAIPPLLFFAAYSFFSAESELVTSISKFEKQRDKKGEVDGDNSRE